MAAAHRPKRISSMPARFSCSRPGRYLRAHNSRHGVLVVGMHDGGRKGWDPPTGGRLRFQEVIAFLQAKAVELERSHPEVKQLTVVGIDFRDITS